jgi:hypothetical protein
LTSEPRKASDILLELEQKLDTALSIIRTQDLNIKILSNKLNSILEALEKKNAEPKVMVEAVNTARMPVSPIQQVTQFDPERQVPVAAEAKLPVEVEPRGFRRTSRPETFAGDDAYLPAPPTAIEPKFPVQVPNNMPKPPPGRGPMSPPPGRTVEATVVAPTPKPVPAPEVPSLPQKQQVTVVQNAIPVAQRVVNGSGKSLFLAEVEIIDLSSMQQIYKTRTNGTGKWMASLGVGEYRVIIRKFEAATKEKLEVTQDIQVDGSQSPLELQTVIIKS